MEKQDKEDFMSEILSKIQTDEEEPMVLDLSPEDIGLESDHDLEVDYLQLEPSKDGVEFDVVIGDPLLFDGHFDLESEHGDDAEISIELPELPGVDGPVEDIVIEEDEADDQQESHDEVADKPKDKWDWQAHGPDGFVAWVKERFESVPKHSGYDTSGLERAISYLTKLDKEISTAMRLDLDGELPHLLIEDVREEIEDALERLEDRLEKVKQSGKKKVKKAELNTMFKTAGTTKINGIVITVPLLISRLARIAINGLVSAGHDLGDTYNRLVKKYKLDDREKAELMQLLSDMGYPLRQDRGVFDEELDVTSSDNMDFAANYPG